MRKLEGIKIIVKLSDYYYRPKCGTGLYNGSFTDDFVEFISWAEEFDALYSETDWNESEKDYYVTLGEFTEEKIAVFKEEHKKDAVI